VAYVGDGGPRGRRKMGRQLNRRQQLPSIDDLRVFGWGVLVPGGMIVALAAFFALALR